MMFLVTVISPILIGYLLVRAFLPVMKPAWVGVLLQLSLGAGCGIGLLSLLHFLVQLVIGPSVAAFWISEGLLLCGAAAAQRLQRDSWTLGYDRTPTAWGLALGGVLAVTIWAQVSHSVQVSESMPHGQWDAWAIWNLRAAFLAQPDATWRGAFSSNLSNFPGGFATHPDYPLLLSGYVARCWALLDSVRDTSAPMWTGALFAGATVALLVSALALLRSWTAAAIGGMILLSNATFTSGMTTQMADIPVGFFFLATVVLLLMADSDREGPGRTMALAGFTAGCAAWTKNEGLLFAAIACVALALCAPMRRTLLFASGLVLPLAVTLYFKFVLAPSEGAGPSLAHFGEAARYTKILTAFWNETKSMGVGLAHPAVYVAVMLAAFGVSPDLLQRRLLQVSLGIWSGMYAGYFLVYVVTPYDLSWHLGTSLGRILSQLTPGATFLVIAICRTAEETKTPILVVPKKRRRA